MLFITSLLVEDFRHSLIVLILLQKPWISATIRIAPALFVCYTILNYANISVSN